MFELIINQPEIVSQSELIKQGWGDRHAHVSTNAFYQCILTLRRVLKDAGLENDIIRTIPRRGLKIPEHVTITLEGEAPTEDIQQPSLVIERPQDDRKDRESHSHFEKAIPPPSIVEVISNTETEPLPVIQEPQNNPQQRERKEKTLRYYAQKTWPVIYFMGMVISAVMIFSQTWENYQSHNFAFGYQKMALDKDGCNFYYNANAVVFDKQKKYAQKTQFDCSRLNNVFITSYLYSTQLSVIQCRFSGSLSSKKYCTSKYYSKNED
ncbi:transcriptional regulator [Paramixta manurensis]|uniref:Transcriptional regulator n=1 Tax=Paramixta manurensis TaxID=2740817 RepID=A0A6M8UI51_9GAMM|nr:transcriptional regulator [Erwiniaceae bacterium PD-1]